MNVSYEEQVELLKTVAQKNLISYVQLCDPKYIVSKVHRYLADLLQQAAERKIKRLIISIPPQHGKSRLTCVEMPTWILGHNPDVNIALTSYAQKLAEKSSREARARVNSEIFQELFPTRVSEYESQVVSWGTNGRGRYKAVGIGGGLTGMPVDYLIVDDPFKDHEEAHSPTRREKVWDWFLSVAYTRLAPDGVVTIIMTRWHTDDLVGRLTDKERRDEMEMAGTKMEEWTVVNLPAIAEEKDPLGRAPGDALYPERYDIHSLKATKAFVGSYKWTALYLGQPVRKGGNYISADDFKVIRRELLPRGMTWMRFWDLATSEDEVNDFTASVKGAMGPAPKGVKVELGDNEDRERCCLYLADMIEGQWEWPRARERIKVTANAERILVGIEAVGGFKTSVANVREVVDKEVMVMEIGVETDKLTRALPWIALAESGRVFLVNGDWIPKFLLQAEAFPSGAHDDQVDAVSGVKSMLASGRKVLIA